MTTTAVPLAVQVTAVLAAIDRYGLLPLLPDRHAIALAGPVALVSAGVVLDPGTVTSLARTLREIEGIVGPALAQAGSAVELPPVPDPVVPKATHAKVAPPTLRIGPDGRIKIERTPFALLDVCRSLPGSKSVRRGGRHAWWTIPSSPAAALAAIEALTPFGVLASRGVSELAEQVGQGASARARFVDGGEIPEGDGTDVVNMPLWDHQRVGVGYAEEASALLLAIPMSGGKTATAIAAVNRRQCARVLIVAPNKVRAVWQREVRERSQIGWHIEDGTRPAKRGTGRIDLSATERLERANRVLFDCDCDAPTHAFVVNYELLGLVGWRDWVPAAPLDAIVYDEIHRLKSPTGTSSKAAARLVSFSRFRLGLSGTPVPQSWWDLFGVFRALDPGIFGETWTPFKAKWAVMRKTKDGRDFPDPRRSTNDAELARLFHSITYRPIVDLDLPPVTDQRVEVELEPAARKVYNDLSENLWADLAAFYERGGVLDVDEESLPWDADDDIAPGAEPVPDGAPIEITANMIMTRLLRLQQLTGGSLRSDPVRDEDGAVVAPGVVTRVSTAKVDMLAEKLDEIGCTGAAAKRGAAEPVVVACRFHTDLDAVRALAEKEGLRYGEVSGRRNDGLDNDGRMSTSVDLCGVQVQAGGTGVDLTRSRFAIMYSVGYSVSDYDQFRSRLVRINQKRPVVILHLVAENTADQAVYDGIDDRRSCVAAVLRDRGFDPARLGIREVTQGARPDSPHNVTVAAHVGLPWEK